MAARQKDWAKRERARLLELLGARCRHCGATADLSFDCIRPMGYRHHALDTSARMSFYRAMHRIGNLQVLCVECNARKGNGACLLTAALAQRARAAKERKEP